MTSTGQVQINSSVEAGQTVLRGINPFRSWALMLCLLGFLWFILINQLHVEWSVNPQYSYGWVVPFLCLGLLSLRWQGLMQGGKRTAESAKSKAEIGKTESGNQFQLSVFSFSAFCFLAFLWLPTRLVQEANPEWRMISWLLALEVIGLSLAVVWLGAGRLWAALFAFPLCFFFVAVPWPTVVEGPLIQLLTRICASISVEVVGWLGIPAVQHGNVIDVVTGTVGVDEACSGIRSFQSSLMISLFLGEFYGMPLVRRIILVPAGFLLALLFNVGRIAFLTSVAARQGVASITKYHDPAGLTIMLACVFSLWLLALLFKKKLKTETGAQKPEIGGQRAEVRGQLSVVRTPVSAFQFSTFQRLSLALLIWLVLAEVGVESWYRWHEGRLPKSVLWSMEWPRGNPTFSELPIGEKTTRLLRYDEGCSVAWRELDGTQWQMFYFRWLPGRIAVHLAKSHTPEVCLGAAGYAFDMLPDLAYLPVRGLELPFREYILNEGSDPVFVFYCLWEDRAHDQAFETTMLNYGTRLGPVLEGRRNVGQRSLEITVRGIGNAKEAEAAVQRQLEKLVKVEKPEKVEKQKTERR